MQTMNTMSIGFIGLMTSGKTTACEHLVKHYGFKKIGFKDALVKEMKDRCKNLLEALSEHYGLSIDDLFKQKPVLMRKLMQDYGTGIRRGDDDQYWIKQFKKAVHNYDTSRICSGMNTSYVCIDDVRFKNEYNAVCGPIIRVIKNGQVNESTHPSETELLDAKADFTITADEGDVESIYRQLDNIMDELQVTRLSFND